MKNQKIIEGELIAERRKELGYTQEQLAEICCVSRDTIASIERGRRTVRTANLSIVLVELDYPLQELKKDIKKEIIKMKWNKLSNNNRPPISDKEYLVTCFDGSPETMVCTWLNKGEKVILSVPRDVNKSGEENLLYQLFSDEAVKYVPRDGFYYRTYDSDYKDAINGIDQTKNTLEFLVCFANMSDKEVYWVELPESLDDLNLS